MAYPHILLETTRAPPERLARLTDGVEFMMENKAIRRLLPVLALACGTAAAQAQQYEFVATPHQGLNRVYRIDRLTGEVGACQYGLRDGSVGVTICYPSGEGAKAGLSGDYGLHASNHGAEAGIFRVNRRSGEMSICYVQNDEQVVCTPPAR